MRANQKAGLKAQTIGFMDLVRPSLNRVEAEMRNLVRSGDPFLDSMALHLLQGGGKRLRPAFIMLSAMSCGGDPDKLVSVAAAAELIHMATLIHDDMVDGSVLRRGVPTVNARWGNRAAILLGDYLFARAFSVLAGTGDNRAVRLMADVVYTLCTGEIEQMGQVFQCGEVRGNGRAHRGNGHDSSGDRSALETRYLERINKKTAYFFAECCRLGAILSGAPDEMVQALGDFGHGIGMGFQIIDDVLDLTSTAEKLGKPVGSDLRSGVITLPVIYVLENDQAGPRIASLIEGRNLGDREINEIQSLVIQSGGVEYAYRVAEQYTRYAFDSLRRLPDGPARQALHGLAEYLIRREF